MSGYPDDWDQRRKKTYRRDGYECQRCGAKGGHMGDTELHAHHKLPKSQGGSHSLDNLETICKECHELEHGHQITKQNDVSSGYDWKETYEYHKSLNRDISWSGFKNGWKTATYHKKLQSILELSFIIWFFMGFPMYVVWSITNSIIPAIIIVLPISLFVLWKAFSEPMSLIPQSIIGPNSGVDHKNGSFDVRSGVYECVECGTKVVGNTTASCPNCDGLVKHQGWEDSDGQAS